MNSPAPSSQPSSSTALLEEALTRITDCLLTSGILSERLELDGSLGLLPMIWSWGGEDLVSGSSGVRFRRVWSVGFRDLRVY